MKSLKGSFFISPSPKKENKGEGRVRNVVEMGIEKVKSVNKNLGGEKRKNENKKQNVGIVGNSNCAVLGAFSGFTCDCR